MNARPELLAPAGDWECIRAAVANGADAVYFGLPRFNARMRAENFTEADLPEVVAFLHAHGVKAYVTVNVLIFTDELADALDLLHLLERHGVDAVIIQDVGLADLARRATPGLRVHASTQMTITSPEGVEFADSLGVRQVVLARELSLRELAKFDAGAMPLEVFVHGALCVAYSGQCLTSESLGQRSANRGECAQACRMPYQLVVDGAVRDLGERAYLLSPQDLAAVREIPDLVARGIRSFKIEGRLKSPEYVAAVTGVYRKAIDAAVESMDHEPTGDDWYRLEMTFSRGLYSGWMHGVNHQELVHARFGKKRGAFLGEVRSAGSGWVELEDACAVGPGDGVVFENPADTDHELGGTVVAVRGNRLEFGPRTADLSRVQPGTRCWKTSDPAMTRELRQTYAGPLPTRPGAKMQLEFAASGSPGDPLVVTATCGTRSVTVQSAMPMELARTRPIAPESLAAQLGKLGGTAFEFAGLRFDLSGPCILPISELNRIRREIVAHLTADDGAPVEFSLARELKEIMAAPAPISKSKLIALCRTFDHIDAALDEGADEILVDFEDIRRYADAVARVQDAEPRIPVFLATPRIQKAGEQGFFKLIENANPDGVLVRNVGAVSAFRESGVPMIGDFSLNVANPLAARVFMDHGLTRLTASYDLDLGQVLALAAGVPSDWLEVTIHQHMPMFHMEHCVFAAFLSNGTDHTNCGRPCESHRVSMRDRVGVDHPLRADVGCRNTVFNAVPQSGAKFFDDLWLAGLRQFRVELLDESRSGAAETLRAYRALVDRDSDGVDLWQALRANSQLGVTRGTY